MNLKLYTCKVCGGEGGEEPGNVKILQDNCSNWSTILTVACTILHVHVHVHVG